MKIPSNKDLLQDFAERHHLRAGDPLEHEALPIRASSLANILTTSGYYELTEAALSDPPAGLMLNMLHRNFSLVEGAIVSFITECGQAAEVAARASVEASINIAYIGSGDAKERMQAYFDHYLTEVDRQVKNWQVSIDGLDSHATEVHLKGVKRRKDANDVLRSMIANSMGSGAEQWPKTIEKRFRALGDALGYRTIYTRMSSEVHADAEETLRHLIGKLGSPEQYEAMALETVWTTRLYVHYAVSSFLRASAIFAGRYGMTDTVGLLKKERADVDTEMLEISKHIGSGIHPGST